MDNDIEIVIKIPKDMKDMCEWHQDGICELVNLEIDILAEAIANGIILPKGHGRLIDASKLKLHEKELQANDISWLFNAYTPEEIDNAPTIIEADEENGND